MLISLIASILISVVFMAGGLYGQSQNPLYAIAAGVIAGLMGVVYGYISDQNKGMAGFELLPGSAYSVMDVWTQMRALIHEVTESTMPIYVAHQGITPVSGMFLARLNGETALVIEGADQTSDTITVHRPLFEKAE